MFSVFLTNLSAYTAGRLIGNWINLPCDNINSELEKIGVIPGVNEYFITDYETSYNLTINEYDNISDLNAIAAELENMDPDQAEIVAILMNDEGYTLKEAIKKANDCIIYYDCTSMGDVAYQILDEDGTLKKLGDLAGYFNFDDYGKYLDMAGNFYKISSGIVEIL